MERALRAVPLPYPLACLLVACLAQTPGVLLARAIDLGSVDGGIQATFPNLATTPAVLLAAGSAFGVGFYTVLMYMIRYSRRALLSSRASIVPLLPDGETGFRRIYGILHSPVAIPGIALTLAVLFWTMSSHEPLVGTAHVVFVVWQLAVVSLATSTVLWTFFVTLWGLRRLGKEPLRLMPYTQDPMLGLRPLGSISVTATTMYFAMVGVVLVTTLFGPQDPIYLAFLLGLVAVGALLFVLPLLGIHRKMLEEKRRVERLLAEEAGREWEAMRAPPRGGATDPGELRDLVLSLREFVAHEHAERKVASLPTWPFDPQVTGRIAAITLTGVVAVLGRAAVDWFLARQ